MKDTLNRVVRTVAQLIVGGTLTAVVSLIAGGLSAEVSALVLAGWTVFVTFVQNYAEDAGWIKAVGK